MEAVDFMMRLTMHTNMNIMIFIKTDFHEIVDTKGNFLLGILYHSPISQVDILVAFLKMVNAGIAMQFMSDFKV